VLRSFAVAVALTAFFVAPIAYARPDNSEAMSSHLSDPSAYRGNQPARPAESSVDCTTPAKEPEPAFSAERAKSGRRNY
jgi:hypothetical protein